MNAASIKILLVEDNPGDARLLMETLRDISAVKFKLTHVDRLGDAFAILDKVHFDVILLDLSLPDAHGFDTVVRLHNHAPNQAIVVLTGTDDDELAVRSVQAGAQDYMVKGKIDGNLIVRAIRYAIERKRTEEELRKANDELTGMNTKLLKTMTKLEKAQTELELALDIAKESDRLKSEFLANTSHELRTPLNSIIGFQKLVLDGMCDSPEEEREFISNSLNSAKYLLKLINDILDIAKIEAGKMDVNLETISLKAIFEEIFLLTHTQTDQKKISLDFSVKDDDVYIESDYQHLKQALLNLVGNAIKFTFRGGIEVLGEAVLEKGVAKIQVKDTGVGIPKEKQKIVFEKFTQADGSTSRKYGGTGLGLSITKNLVELVGGTIELVSAGSGKGSNFILTQPLAEESMKEKPESTPDKINQEIHRQYETDITDQAVIADTSSAIIQENRNIVIIEDNTRIRLYLEGLLQKSGYQTFSTKTADSGYDLIQKVRPHCVIIDFGLSYEVNSLLHDGLSLVSALQENNDTHHIPIILITGDKEQVHQILSIQSSVSIKPTVLGKPINENRLLSFLDEFSRVNGKQSLNILIADDDPNVGKYLGKILSKKGYQLMLAENGREALEYIKKNENSIDLLLLDLMMPVMNGYEVIKKIKINKSVPDLPIIIITNYPETDSEEQDKLLGKSMVLDLITKEEMHNDPEILLALLKNVTGRQAGGNIMSINT